jgi:hypothetical protein
MFYVVPEVLTSTKVELELLLTFSNQKVFPFPINMYSSKQMSGFVFYLSSLFLEEFEVWYLKFIGFVGEFCILQVSVCVSFLIYQDTGHGLCQTSRSGLLVT